MSPPAPHLVPCPRDSCVSSSSPVLGSSSSLPSPHSAITRDTTVIPLHPLPLLMVTFSLTSPQCSLQPLHEPQLGPSASFSLHLPPGSGAPYSCPSVFHWLSFLGLRPSPSLCLSLHHPAPGLVPLVSPLPAPVPTPSQPSVPRGEAIRWHRTRLWEALHRVLEPV